MNLAANDTNNPAARRRLAVALAVALLLPILLFAMGFAAHRLMQKNEERAARQSLAPFWQAWEILDRYYNGELPSAQERTYGAIRGALATLNDPYTIFVEPPQGEIERDQLSGTYGGIGVDLWRDDAGNTLLFPYPDSPAAAAGVQSGDQLLAVDGQSVLTATLDSINALLHGEVGTAVTLTLSRPPTPPFDLTITRAEINLPSVTYRLLEGTPPVGYLHITTFTERTPEETEAALHSLTAAGATVWVLDLRDNGGGLIQSASAVADLFLDSDQVMFYQVRQRDEETAFRAHPGGPGTEGRLAILVNGSTASAAEIVAGALQAHGRGPLIGEPTFGKGSVQMIFPLSDGSSLHVTAAVWLLPDRQPVSPEGLTPDLPVAAGGGTDPQLEQARQYLETGD
jgi:carboxyl-terminal processing protease